MARSLGNSIITQPNSGVVHLNAIGDYTFSVTDTSGTARNAYHLIGHVGYQGTNIESQGTGLHRFR